MEQHHCRHSIDNAIVVASVTMTHETNPRDISNWTCGAAPLVSVTAALTVPIVADGAAPLTPFSARATSESAAKPIAGGLYWNTE
jgi:hypothetical protein